ncbi:MAG: hypothetical protein J0H94_12405 [Rhizobiales bacterium]|nr:hypothetical protein [Hyphomicrobiales bacterium]
MRFLRVLAAAALAASVPAAAMAADFYSYNCPTPVVIHKAPKKAAPRIATVPRYSSVRVYRCDGWCEVTWGPYRGFVEGRFVVQGKHLAKKLTATPKYANRLKGPYVPVYVAPQTAWISSQTVDCCGRPNGRVWYFDGRYVDHPDVFRFLQR